MSASTLKLQLDNIIATVGSVSRDVRRDYISWIKNNPSRASDIETTVKVLSYLCHGRLKSTTGSVSIIPELLYSASNLLAFWHDSLLRAEAEKLTRARANSFTIPPTQNGFGPSTSTATHAQPQHQQNNNNVKDNSYLHLREIQTQRIKTCLTILEYFDVFLEVSAKKLWGDVGRWIIILIVQAVKTSLRAALLFHYKVGLIESPALQPYERRKTGSDSLGVPAPNMVFILKHSGRVVRKIHASPPLASRNWKLPTVPTLNSIPNDLPPLRLLAEVIHILRPLAHLVGLGIWGTRSWKPWVVSLAMDVSSLQLHGTPIRMRPTERIELTRRTYALLYYLIRSPFYDRFTKRRMLASLLYLAQRLPIAGHVCKMLADAIPEWQQTYSYVWNDT
jgi:peroxin-16